MADTIILTKTKNRLYSASDRASMAYWTLDNFHVSAARERLVDAMSGAEHDADQNEALKEIITTAIEDSFDVDWQAKDAAQGVIDAILDACLPMIKEDAGE
jgi:hypothetical protein